MNTHIYSVNKDELQKPFTSLHKRPKDKRETLYQMFFLNQRHVPKINTKIKYQGFIVGISRLFTLTNVPGQQRFQAQVQKESNGAFTLNSFRIPSLDQNYSAFLRNPALQNIPLRWLYISIKHLQTKLPGCSHLHSLATHTHTKHPKVTHHHPLDHPT